MLYVLGQRSTLNARTEVCYILLWRQIMSSAYPRGRWVRSFVHAHIKLFLLFLLCFIFCSRWVFSLSVYAFVVVFWNFLNGFPFHYFSLYLSFFFAAVVFRLSFQMSVYFSRTVVSTFVMHVLRVLKFVCNNSESRNECACACVCVSVPALRVLLLL